MHFCALNTQTTGAAAGDVEKVLMMLSTLAPNVTTVGHLLLIDKTVIKWEIVAFGCEKNLYFTKYNRKYMVLILTFHSMWLIKISLFYYLYFYN